MTNDLKRQEILTQIKRIASENGGNAPGQTAFATVSGIKEHIWRGKFWRNWSEALGEAGFTANKWIEALSDEEICSQVIGLSRKLQRFPKVVDFTFEANRSEFPSANAIKRRWNMMELAEKIRQLALENGDVEVQQYAEAYIALNSASTATSDQAGDETALGYVYLISYGSDYKIGRTNSLNKRSRQIQIELPKETLLVHSILTDDPIGIEAYWHKRFADKRTRGEWFKLSKTDVAAFKRWSKIW